MSILLSLVNAYGGSALTYSGADSVIISDVIVKSVGVNFLESVVITESLNIKPNIVTNDSVVITDVISKHFYKVFTEDLYTSDIFDIAGLSSLFLSDVITLTDNFIISFNKVISDSVNVNDIFSYILNNNLITLFLEDQVFITDNGPKICCDRRKKKIIGNNVPYTIITNDIPKKIKTSDDEILMLVANYIRYEY